MRVRMCVCVLLLLFWGKGAGGRGGGVVWRCEVLLELGVKMVRESPGVLLARLEVGGYVVLITRSPSGYV